MNINIAIDGPSSAGKSTIAKAIAKKLNMIHIDTGAMYRSCALAIMNGDIDIDNPRELDLLLKGIVIDFDNDGNVLLNGIDVTDKIRTDEISLKTSEISSIPQIREKLVELQRSMSSKKGYILDGRDIGTVVLKDAEVKIFMVASAECRAKRRYQEYLIKGQDVNYDDVYQAIVQRDYQDTHRKVSPLKKADDAIELDTSTLTIDEVVKAVEEIVNNKIEVM